MNSLDIITETLGLLSSRSRRFSPFRGIGTRTTALTRLFVSISSLWTRSWGTIQTWRTVPLTAATAAFGFLRTLAMPAALTCAAPSAAGNIIASSNRIDVALPIIKPKKASS